MNRVMQTDRLKGGIEFMITVRALADNAQIPIDFGKSWKCDRIKQDVIGLDGRLVRLFGQIAGQVPRLNAGLLQSRTRG